MLFIFFFNTSINITLWNCFYTDILILLHLLYPLIIPHRFRFIYFFNLKVWQNVITYYKPIKTSTQALETHASCDITSNDSHKDVFSAGATGDIPGPILQCTYHGCRRGAAWESICLLAGPPPRWAHRADWSAMWGGCTTARRAPLYGSGSFYTCCITVKDKQHTYCGSNYRVSKQHAFRSVTLTGERAARRFDSSCSKAAS